MRLIEVALEEPQHIHEKLSKWNIELGLNARVERKNLETFDFIYSCDEGDNLVKCGSERKHNDFFKSLQEGRLFSQVRRMIESRIPSILQISIPYHALNMRNKKTVSTTCSQLTALGIPTLTYPNDTMLCHGFIKYCLAEAHNIMPKFWLMPDPVEKTDSIMIKMLKQFPLLGKKKSTILGTYFNTPLEIAGVRIPRFEKLDDIVEKTAWRISDVLRAEKSLKNKPEKPLSVAIDLARFLYGVHDDG